MPKDPIQGRTLLYETLRDGTHRLLDYCLVNTSVGLCVESRSILRANGNMQNEDVYDTAFTNIEPVDETIRGQLGLNAYQWPVNFNTL